MFQLRLRENWRIRNFVLERISPNTRSIKPFLSGVKTFIRLLVFLQIRKCHFKQELSLRADTSTLKNFNESKTRRQRHAVLVTPPPADNGLALTPRLQQSNGVTLKRQSQKIWTRLIPAPGQQLRDQLVDSYCRKKTKKKTVFVSELRDWGLDRSLSWSEIMALSLTHEHSPPPSLLHTKVYKVI